MRKIQIMGSSLMNTTFTLLQNFVPSVSRISLNKVILSQKRNKSTNLDKELAQNLFFSQHRPVLFDDIKFEFEIQTLQNEKAKVIEPVPFSNSIPKKCKSYGEMKYSNPGLTEFEKSEEEKSQILAAWDILDCMFTGHTSSSTSYKEEENMSSSGNIEPQPLKSISEDTFLSCVNNSLYQQEEDDIDIDILFHQLFKDNSTKSSNNSSSSNTSSNPINSKDTLKK
jgi:hypothetical protein